MIKMSRVVQENQFDTSSYDPTFQTTTGLTDLTKTYDPNANRAFNQFTRGHYDTCEYENQLRLGAKPMTYYVNQMNSPQVNSFQTFSMIGNQKPFGVSNNYDRALPSRLNPNYQSYTLPYSTTPFLGSAHPAREYNETGVVLRFGNDIRPKKSSVALSEVDYNQWSPGVNAVTVQNAGQFTGGTMQQPIGQDGYFDYSAQNNVLFANSAWPVGGISSRNQLHNFQIINNC